MSQDQTREKVDKFKVALVRLRAVMSDLRTATGSKPRKTRRSRKKTTTSTAPRHKKSCDQKTPNSGVGTELTNILAELGIEPKAECSCKSLAGKLNRNGVEWCRQHLAEIVAAMQQNTVAYNWHEKAGAGLKSLPLVLSGKLNPLQPIRSLVLLAIERAEEKP